MESYVHVEELNLEVSFEEYYTEIHRLSLLKLLKKYTIGLPRLIINTLKSKKDITTYNSNTIQIISETDKEMMKLYRNNCG